jgi:hypothetical protein
MGGRCYVPPKAEQLVIGHLFRSTLAILLDLRRGFVETTAVLLQEERMFTSIDLLVLHALLHLSFSEQSQSLALPKKQFRLCSHVFVSRLFHSGSRASERATLSKLRNGILVHGDAKPWDKGDARACDEAIEVRDIVRVDISMNALRTIY